MKSSNKKVWLFVVLLVIVVAVVLAVRSSASKNNKGPLTIGFVGPLTGAPAVWGEGARNMVALAVEDINAKGGINGRELVVDYQDGKCSPQDGLSALQNQKLRGIKFIIGGHCSPETSGMVPATADGSVFMIAGVTSSDNAVAASKYAYRTSPANAVFTDKLAALAFTKYKKVAVITEEAAFSKSYSDDFVKDWEAKGGEIVSNQGYAPNESDFRSDLIKIKQANPDAILVSPQSPATGANIARQMTELGMKIPVFGNSVLITEKVFEQSGNAGVLKGAFSIIPYTNNAVGKAATLAAQYKAKYNSDVPYNFFYVAASYDATHILASALAKCGEDTKCVANYFATVHYEGSAATYSFKDNGDSTFDSFATITLGQDGKAVIVPLK